MANFLSQTLATILTCARMRKGCTVENFHEFGNVAGFRLLLVLDVWEHAYPLDFQPSERGEYIESFLLNVNWDVVAKRQ